MAHRECLRDLAQRSAAQMKPADCGVVVGAGEQRLVLDTGQSLAGGSLTGPRGSALDDAAVAAQREGAVPRRDGLHDSSSDAVSQAAAAQQQVRHELQEPPVDDCRRCSHAPIPTVVAVTAG
jgi:hypothetical protein